MHRCSIVGSVDGVPELKFAPARGARIGYQDFGGGDATIVAVPPAAQNVEVAWERLEIRRMLERFASFARFIPFDKRGTGSSDRAMLVPGIDERVDDLRAVMDDAGVDRAHLFAQSEGGPMTLLFAATYPHRVESVILHGSGARLAPPNMTAAERAASIERRTRFAEVWGTSDSEAVDLFAPSMVDDAEFRAWHQRYERLSAGFDSLRDLLIQMMDVDVAGVLPTIEVPVLVLHRRDDVAVPIELGRELAELVPNAELVELDGMDHFAYLGDVDGWMNRVERWVTGTVAPRSVDPPAGDVRVHTLGRFGVSVGGREVATREWGSRRARTLLKRLVVARGWPVTRDELADALWPAERDPERLGARLSVQLSAVRRVLGGGVIADRQTVALDLGHVSTDLEMLLTATDDRAVIDAYGGEFLPEERYEDWAAPMREQARSRFTRAAHRRLSELIDDRESGSAVDLAESVLSADPYDEAAYVALADAHEQAGDPAAAERTRQRMRDVMQELFRKDS